MRKLKEVLLCIFAIACTAIFLLVPFDAKKSIGESEYPVLCYITVEPADGLEHEYYVAGDVVFLVAHIENVHIYPATQTDLEAINLADEYVITWQRSRVQNGIEYWDDVGTGDRYLLVLNAEPDGIRYRFFATPNNTQKMQKNEKEKDARYDLE